jgi:hypothetical protein
MMPVRCLPSPMCRVKSAFAAAFSSSRKTILYDTTFPLSFDCRTGERLSRTAAVSRPKFVHLLLGFDIAASAAGGDAGFYWSSGRFD